MTIYVYKCGYPPLIFCVAILHWYIYIYRQSGLMLKVSYMHSTQNGLCFQQKRRLEKKAIHIHTMWLSEAFMWKIEENRMLSTTTFSFDFSHSTWHTHTQWTTYNRPKWAHRNRKVIAYPRKILRTWYVHISAEGKGLRLVSYICMYLDLALNKFSNFPHPYNMWILCE